MYRAAIHRLEGRPQNIEGQQHAGNRYAALQIYTEWLSLEGDQDADGCPFLRLGQVTWILRTPAANKASELPKAKAALVSPSRIQFGVPHIPGPRITWETFWRSLQIQVFLAVPEVTGRTSDLGRGEL